jgi:hypothetical protein
MKKIFIIVLFVVMVINAAAQQWAIKASNAGNTGGWFTKADKNGYVYTTGWFEYTVNFGSSTISSTGYYDGFIVKTDTSGNVIWAKSFGTNTADDLPKVISVDDSNNVIVAGTQQWNDTVQIDSILITTGYIENAFVAKFNPNGTVLWAKASPGMLTINDIVVDTHNNINLIGTIDGYSIIGNDTILPYFDSVAGGPYSTDILLIQYNNSGTLNWVKRFGGNGYDIGNSITTDLNDNIYFAGEIESAASFDTITQITSNNNYINPDAFIAKCNSSGNAIWVKNYGAISCKSSGEEIKYTGLNRLYFGGHFTNSIPLAQDTLTGNSNNFISKLDTLGNFMWADKCGEGYISGMDIDQQKNVFICGVIKDTAILGMDTLITGGVYNTFISKIDSNGVFIWSEQGKGMFENSAKSLSLDLNYNAYITGYFSSDTTFFGPFGLTAYPYTGGAFIVKYGNNNSSTFVNENTLHEQLSIYPNPTTTTFTITSTEKIKEVRMYNVLGYEILKQVQNDQSATIDISSVSQGIYFVEIKTEKGIVRKKVVKE